MPGVYADWAPTLPTSWLVWLATGSLRLALYRAQGLHDPLRFLHVIATAGFFGAILVLDLRLLGRGGREVGVAALAHLVLPVVHACFAALILTGALLFLFDPIQAGSHSWFLPKMALIGLGMGNALLLSRRRAGRPATLGDGIAPRRLRAAALVSLLVWTAVIACATANQVERPLVRARHLERSGSLPPLPPSVTAS